MPLRGQPFSLLIFLICLLLAITACSHGSRPNDPVIVSKTSINDALKKAVDSNILPAVDNFAIETEKLETEVSQFCLAPSIDSLSVLQNNWRSVAEGWYRLAVYNFGPVNDDIVFPAFMYIDSLRLRGTDYTATVRDDVASDILGTTALNRQYFNSKPFQKLGLLALEVLIFENSTNSSHVPADIVAEYQQNARKCELLTQQAQLLNIRAAYIYKGWHVSFKEGGRPFRDLFLNRELEDGTEPVTLLLTSAQAYLDYIRQRKVTTTAARLSMHIWPLLNESITEIEQLLVGASNSRISFFSLMTSSGYSGAVDTVKENIAFAHNNIQQQNSTDFDVAISLLDGNFKREIPNSLEVQLGINFTDGD